MILLRLVDNDGVTGLGEAVPLSLRGGADLAQIHEELDRWCRRDEATSTIQLSPPSRCAIQTALSDLEARREGVPLWQLLDESATPRTLACNATITAGDTADVLAQCETWAEDGFAVFKLKAAADDAVTLAAALRADLGPHVRIRFDANGTWGRRAEAVLADLEPFNIELVEEPILGLASLSVLSQRTSIPLVADESVNNDEEAAGASVLKACRAVAVKISKIGGLGVDLGGHLPTYLSSALDGPVGIAAAVHAAQILPADSPWPGIAHGLATERLFESTISNEGPLLDGATLPLPGGTGLGITIDEKALRAARI